MTTINGTNNDDVLNYSNLTSETLNGLQGNDLYIADASDVISFNNPHYNYRFSEIVENDVLKYKVNNLTFNNINDGLDTITGEIKYLLFTNGKYKLRNRFLTPNTVSNITKNGASYTTAATAFNLINNQQSVTSILTGTLSATDIYKLPNSFADTDVEIILENYNITANPLLTLWNDKNNDKIKQTGEVFNSLNTGSANEYIFKNNLKGTNYIEVKKSASPDYSYKLLYTQKQSIASINTYTSPMLSTGENIFNSTLGSVDKTDIYSVVLEAPKKFTLTFSSEDNYLNPNINIAIDANANNIADVSELVYTGLLKDYITPTALVAGKYIFKIYDSLNQSQSTYAVNFKYTPLAEDLTGYFINKPNKIVGEIKSTSIDKNWNLNGEFGIVDDFKVTWFMELTPTESGLYTFYSGSDDATRLWLDGNLIIDHWQFAPFNEKPSSPIYLNAGQKYYLKYDYAEAGQEARVLLQWSSDTFTKKPITNDHLQSIKSTGTGLKADYFNGKNFDSFVGTRIENPFQTYSSTSPMPGIGTDNFSVRWEGNIFIPTPTKLLTYTDDGIRVWIDNILVINNWTDHPGTEDRSPLISRGNHAIKIEYYQGGGGAEMELSFDNRWQIPTEFFSYGT